MDNVLQGLVRYARISKVPEENIQLGAECGVEMDGIVFNRVMSIEDEEPEETSYIVSVFVDGSHFLRAAERAVFDIWVFI